MDTSRTTTLSAASALPTGDVTFVFTDIEGSTRLIQTRPAEYRVILERHREILRESFRRGAEFGSEGDAMFFAFADPANALEAAVDAQHRLAAESWPDGLELRVRMGISTGAADIVGEGYVGVELHRVSRICAAAHGAQVLVGRSTSRACEGRVVDIDLNRLGEFRLKDFAEPEPLYQADPAGHMGRFPPPRTALARTVALPRESSSLIGRDRDVEDLQRLVLAHRLVTITGTGGSGKTRLAMRVAWNLAPRIPGSVAFVPLAPLSASDQVPGALGRALGSEGVFRTWQDVIVRFRDQSVLIVLDNAEHLPHLGRFVGDALDQCPHLRVLVTSRTPLALSGERLHPLDRLAIEDAVQLLGERARERRPAFDDRAAAPELRSIATSLGCLPLAIELGAARLRALSPAALAALLDHQLDILHDEREDIPERQRDMRSAISWSHRLLDEDDARLFAAMSVFPAPARIAGIAHVAGVTELEALEGLTRLVDASLVFLVDHPTPRFGMLEPVRQFAAEQLAAAGLEVHARDRMVAWYEAEVGDDFDGSSHAQLAGDTENVVAALGWCAGRGDWERWIDLVYPISYFFLETSGATATLTGWIDDAESRQLSGRATARLAVVRALIGGDFEVARWRTAVAESQAAGAAAEEDAATAFLTNALILHGQMEDAVETLDRLIDRTPRSAFVRRWTFDRRAIAADMLGAPDTESRWDAAEAVARSTGRRELVITHLMWHALYALGRGAIREANHSLAEANDLARAIRSEVSRVMYYEVELAYLSGLAALLDGRPRDAAPHLSLAIAEAEHVLLVFPLQAILTAAAAALAALGQSEDASAIVGAAGPQRPSGIAVLDDRLTPLLLDRVPASPPVPRPGLDLITASRLAIDRLGELTAGARAP